MSLFGHGQVKLGKVGQYLPGFTNVRIDRASVFGNPYTVKAYGRATACDMYDQYLKALEPDSDAFLRLQSLRKRVRKGENLLLCCHCVDAITGVGKRCHGASIMRYIV